MAECPNCGENHEQGQWVPADLDIDRDLTAMVANVLSKNGSIADFAALMGSMERGPSLVLRACQAIAMYAMEIVLMQGASEEEARELAHTAMQNALLRFADMAAETPPTEEGGTDGDPSTA